MGATLDDGELAGDVVEVDGAYFGKGKKPANQKAERVDRRSDTVERQVVVVARERRGRARSWVVRRESEGVTYIRRHVASGTEIHADEAAGWNMLHASYPTRRVNHSVEYVTDDGVNVNQAESFFARLRRAEFGIHHRISGHRLQAYADEMSWRENHRREANGTHWNLITAAALTHPKSATWAGYWHPRMAA